MLAVEVLAVRLGIPLVIKFVVIYTIVVTVLTVSNPSMNNATRSVFLHGTVVDLMRRDWMSAYLRYPRSYMLFFFLRRVGLIRRL